jgi:aldose 1-epimerase
VIRVTYTLEHSGGLRITYDAVCDRDTVFNLTNHSYFNLAGHDRWEEAMKQTLMLPSRFFNPDDEENIPTGELRSVVGTPMDFRSPKPLGRDIGADYEPLKLQGGYDHNFEVFCNPCAILKHEASGRTMAVYTDCPGVQLYTANFTNDTGKDGAGYPKRSSVCLETQYYPNSLNHPEWPQPITPAGQPYHSERVYRFE